MASRRFAAREEKQSGASSAVLRVKFLHARALLDATEPKRARTAGASRRGVSARPDRVPARTLIPTTSSTPSTSAIRNRAVKPYSSWGNPSWRIDRKSVVWGKSVSVRVDLGGGRIIKKK